MRRYAGLMLAVERTTLRLLGERARSDPHGVYGYELAEILHQETSASLTEKVDTKSLRANGTVYKILYRLSRIGAVTSHWEEADVALAEGRPRRRYYVLTENGRARAANLERKYQRRLRRGLPETDPRPRV
jgi:PadR family transcriptional regulator PadR